MSSYVIALVGVVVGLALIAFRAPFSRYVIRQQNKVPGFHFGDREVKITEVMSFLAGIIFCIFGILALFWR